MSFIDYIRSSRTTVVLFPSYEEEPYREGAYIKALKINGDEQSSVIGGNFGMIGKIMLCYPIDRKGA